MITQWLAEAPNKIEQVKCLGVADDCVFWRVYGVKVSSPRESKTHKYCDTWEEAKAFLMMRMHYRLDKLRAEEMEAEYQYNAICAMTKPEYAND